MTRKLKLSESVSQDVGRLMDTAKNKRPEVKPSTIRMRKAFARLFEENELMSIVYQKTMATRGADNNHLFEQIPSHVGAHILRTSISRAQYSAKIMVERLEKASGEYGYDVDLMDATKEEIRRLPGFDGFMDDCISHRIVTVKALREDGKESQPLLFSPNIILAQEKEGPVEFVYNPYTNFSHVLNGLAFR